MLAIRKIASVLFIAPAMASAQSTESSTNNNSITITESGVARSMQTSKRIYCGDIEWRIVWEADDQGSLNEVEVAFLKENRGIFLKDAALELAGRVTDVDSVSATCSISIGGENTRSNLLLLALDKEDGVPLLAELVINPDNLTHTWRFSER